VDVETGEITEETSKARPKIGRELLAWLVVVFLLGIAAGALIVTFGKRSNPPSIIISTRSPEPTPMPAGSPAPMKIYVSGEVVEPAVYELPAGAIIEDLIFAAGGFTESAEHDVVNLAYSLSDGMHIHVPSKEEEIMLPVVSGGSGSAGVTSAGSVNINQAALQDLESLPGIGPSLAQAVLDYRDLNGVFEEIDEIMEVPGIGPAKFEAIKDLISLK
jgi:competence protein ComEA